MYTIGNIKKIDQEEILTIQNLVDFELPQDFLFFLTEYGYGGINDTLFFQRPDNNYVKNNFSEYMDLWNWKNETQKEIALNGLTIATTDDGDIVSCVKNEDFPYLILPRHSQNPIFIDKFPHLLLHYFKTSESEYFDFDSFYQSNKKNISLVKDEELDKIVGIQKAFIEKYQFDKVINKEIRQPKYILPEIGGWVCFDLIYKNNIRIKYQSMFESKTKEIIEFIEQQIKMPNA